MYALAPSVIRLRRMPERKRRSPDELYRARAGRRHLGASFLFMRIGAPEFGPFALAALRVAIAALVLSPVLCSTTARTQLAQHVKPLFVVGMTNSAMPFCLFAYAMLSLSAGFESILNATAPLWGALIAYVWL